MAERSPNDPRRVSSLETGMSDVVRNLNPRDTIAQPGSVSWPKMAYTDYGPDGIYPSAGVNPNTYWIKFVDATFDDTTAGMITRTVNKRQVVARALVQNIASDYIPRESLIEVWPQNNRFWTCYRGGGGGDGPYKIPFKNDSGYTAPAFAVMQVKDTQSNYVTATVNTSTDVWTTASPHGFATGDEVRYTTQGVPPTTSPAGELTSGVHVWARVLSATTLTLHPSNVDATANTNVIDCTTTGSGTHRLGPASASELLVIRRPDPSVISAPHTDLVRIYVVNEGAAVDDGKTGRCTYLACSYDYPVRVLYDPSEWTGTPAQPVIGDSLGPKKDSWKLAKYGYGFTVLGDPDKNPVSGDASIVVLPHRLAIHVPDDTDSFLAYNSASESSSDNNVSAFGVGTTLGFGAVHQGANLIGNLMSPKYANAKLPPEWAFQPYPIVGPDPIVAQTAGIASFATDRPAWVKYETAQGSPSQDGWGPVPGGGDKIYRGAPGFVILGYDSDRGLALVVRDVSFTVFFAKAYGNWTDPGSGAEPYVDCRLYDYWASQAYDGSLAHYPEFKLRVFLPRYGQKRDPNVLLDDLVPFRFSNVRRYASATVPLVNAGLAILHAGDYLDDAIGTVKMWKNSAASIPRGWREYTAMQDRFPIGVKNPGSAIAVGSIGGATTHTHTVSGSSGTYGGSTKVIDAANHLPPYSGIYFIERYL